MWELWWLSKPRKCFSIGVKTSYCCSLRVIYEFVYCCENNYVSHSETGYQDQAAYTKIRYGPIWQQCPTDAETCNNVYFPKNIGFSVVPAGKWQPISISRKWNLRPNVCQWLLHGDLTYRNDVEAVCKGGFPNTPTQANSKLSEVSV